MRTIRAIISIKLRQEFTFEQARPPLKLEDSRSESAGNSRVPSLEGVPSFTEAGRA